MIHLILTHQTETLTAQNKKGKAGVIGFAFDSLQL